MKTDVLCQKYTFGKMFAGILKNQENALQIKEKCGIVYYSNDISCRRKE